MTQCTPNLTSPAKGTTQDRKNDTLFFDPEDPWAASAISSYQFGLSPAFVPDDKGPHIGAPRSSTECCSPFGPLGSFFGCFFALLRRSELDFFFFFFVETSYATFSF